MIRLQEVGRRGRFRASATVDAGEGALFDHLSQVGNLPDYFARMTSAKQGDGEEVHTTAQLPDGRQVEGDAWFRVDPGAGRIEWGSEGPNDYHGSLEVSAAGAGAKVVVSMHTTRIPDGRRSSDSSNSRTWPAEQPPHTNATHEKRCHDEF